MIPTELVLPLGIRTVNAFKDPEAIPRPITQLSWSPDQGKRLAASYCFAEFQRVSSDLNSCSYIWDIENPNVAFMGLKAVDSLLTIQFNPHDPSMLISGLMSGQVCSWDIRTSDTPIFISHLQYSHKNPVNCILWTNSKTNTEFFSGSTDGTICWWDIRMLRKPTEILIMDLENPIRGDTVKAVGVSSLQFEPTIGTKFMVGMENGIVVSGSRKGKNPVEKMSMRFDCHCGPVVAIDRNSFATKNFLTIGDWTTKIWAEDTKEGNLISTTHHRSIPAGGCWSTSRYSVFYVINNDGMIQVFDVLVGIKDAVLSSRVCKEGLTAIAAHQLGKFIAVGNNIGTILILEASEALTTNGPNDKNLMATYLERCSRHEKAVDNRLKETRLMQRVAYAESELAIPSARVKAKDKSLQRKSMPKDKKFEERRKSERDRKKIRKKSKDIWQVGDPKLIEDERNYFETLVKEKEKYANAIDGEKPIARKGYSVFSMKESSIKRGKEDLRGDKMLGNIKSGTRKERSSKGVGGVKDKKTTGRFSKMKEIIIVRKNSDIVEGEKTEGKLTEEILDEIEKIGITGEEGELDGSEKYLEQTTSDEDDKDPVGGVGSRGKKIIVRNKKNGLKYREKRKPLFKLDKKFKILEPGDQPYDCDSICGDFIVESKQATDDEYEDIEDADERDSLLEFEEAKIKGLVEEMYAGLSKNLLPLEKTLSREEKEFIFMLNNAKPNVLKKELRKINKRKLEGTFETDKIVEHQKLSAIGGKDPDRKKMSVKFSVSDAAEPEKTRNLSSNDESLQKIKGRKSKADDCSPIATTFGPEEILGVIGAKVELKRESKKEETIEPKILKDKNEYPRISSIDITKQ
ncbi:Similar to Dynein intermediate chain 3 [Cotesia congregata]|uniref:Ciliary (Heliocidaris crassispina) n=1 Tax=Cotesia congregata TaxID=51543 RepID=A0A8J2HKW5_COTCN|nr:Similar to Dynein intermediate chain 3 [Cotesia congregata]